MSAGLPYVEQSLEREPAASSLSFDLKCHVTFLQMMHHILPHDYQSQEINHLTLAYFAISGLDILGAIDSVDKNLVASWVLSFQALPGGDAGLNSEKVIHVCEEKHRTSQFYGFNGSRSSQYPSDCGEERVHNHSHLAATYCAIAILKTVGYSLSNIDAKSILVSMRNLQLPDGSFLPIHIGAEADLRFTYCAAAICFMLGDWSGMDRDLAMNYVVKCQSYDGGFGMVPGSESHAGGTYCAIASLRLMGYIGDNVLSNCSPSSILDISLLLEWCLQKQTYDGGFQGRLNKASDTCYAFWVVAILKLLGAQELIDAEALRQFLLSCQFEFGGFSKFQGEMPDLYHSYYGCMAFGLLEEPGLNPLCLELGITAVAASGR